MADCRTRHVVEGMKLGSIIDCLDEKELCDALCPGLFLSATYCECCVAGIVVASSYQAAKDFVRRQTSRYVMLANSDVGTIVVPHELAANRTFDCES